MYSSSTDGFDPYRDDMSIIRLAASERRALLGYYRRSGVHVWAAREVGWVLMLSPTQFRFARSHMGATRCRNFSTSHATGLRPAHTSGFVRRCTTKRLENKDAFRLWR
jgi:hypothetical protein